MNTSQLVNRAIQGDNAAKTELYHLTNKKAYSLALQMTKSKEEAEDILQESYLKAFSSLDTMTNASNFPSWFYCIVSNKCKDYLKSKRHGVMMFSDLSGTDDSGDETDFEPEDESTDFSPEKNADLEDTARLMREMIANLPEEQRLVVIMHYLDGLQVKEIAEALQVSENTVKSRLNYARKKFRTQAEDMESKGFKLRSIGGTAALFGFVAWVLRTQAEATETPAAADMLGRISPSSSSAASAASAAGSTAASAQAGARTAARSAAHAGAKAAAFTGKAAKKGMGTVTKIIVAASAAAIAAASAVAVVTVVNPDFRAATDVFGWYGMRDQATPERTVKRFENAFNEGDLETVIKTMPPDYQRQFEKERKITQSMAGLFGGMFSYDSMGGMLSIPTVGEKLNVSVSDVTYYGSDLAIVTAHASCGAVSKDMKLGMSKTEGQWYFTQEGMQAVAGLYDDIHKTFLSGLSSYY